MAAKRTSERIDVRVPTSVRDLIYEASVARGIPMSEFAYIAICEKLGIDPALNPIPRGKVGRPAKPPAKAKRAK